MKNKHVTHEELSSFINGSFNNVKSSYIEAHIDNCSKCLNNYTEMTMFLEETDNVKINKIPSSILDSINLSTTDNSNNLIGNIINNIKNFIQRVLFPQKPSFRYATIGLSLIILIIVGLNIDIISNPSSDTINNFGNHKLEFTANDGLKYLSVIINTDSISISQKIRIPRKIQIYDNNGLILLDDSFSTFMYSKSLKEYNMGEYIHFIMITDGFTTIDSIFTSK